MIFYHLPPQDRIDTLIQATNHNYSIANNYYTQRRKMFKTFLTNQLNIAQSKVLQDLENNIQEAVQTYWTEGARKLAQDIMFGTKEGEFVNTQSVTERLEKIDVDNSYFTEALIKAIKGQDYRQFWTALGIPFEQVLANEVLPAAFNHMARNANGQIQNLLSIIPSGSLTSTASTVSGQRAIRPDLIVGCSGISFQKDDSGVLRSNEGLPVELQGQLQIGLPEESFTGTTLDIQHNDILQRFLSEAGSQFFGFSAKTWNGNTNNKAFGHSSQLQSMLNKQFNQRDPFGKRHGWERNYTMEYIIYILSRNLINIMSPTNIAFITGQGLLWMDDFLQGHMFFMRAQLQGAGKDASGNDRYFPNIVDSSIYIRIYSAQASNAFVKRVIGRSYRGSHGMRILTLSLKFGYI